MGLPGVPCGPPGPAPGAWGFANLLQPVAGCGSLWRPSPAPGVWRFGNLWQPVAGCGGLWHPVAAEFFSRGREVWQPVAGCGGLWRRSPAPYIILLEESKHPRMEYWKLQYSRPGLAS